MSTIRVKQFHCDVSVALRDPTLILLVLALPSVVIDGHCMH